jgi:hypothetical protein
MAQHYYLSEPLEPRPYHIFVGATTADGRGAICRAYLSASGGRLSAGPSTPPCAVVAGGDGDGSSGGAAATFAERGAPWFAVSPGGERVYAVLREGAKEQHNYVAAFDVDASTGELTVLSTAHTILAGSPHCVVDPSAKMVVCAHMSGGGVSVLPLCPAGALGRATAHRLPGGGSGVNTSGGCQSQCFAHSVQLAMGGTHVLVPDRGADKVWCFELDSEAVALRPAPVAAWAAAAGSGPRHLAAVSVGPPPRSVCRHPGRNSGAGLTDGVGWP